MAELQRLSPALWGLAELARLTSDVDGAMVWCERGLAASREVTDAAYLYPYLVTGVRVRLEAADVPGAGEWVRSAGELIRARSIPGRCPRSRMRVAWSSSPRVAPAPRTQR